MKFTKIDKITPPSHPNNYSIASKGNFIEFKLIDWTEPINGRMLHVVNLIINGEDRTAEYFPDGNRVLFELTKYQFTDSAQRFCFIPAESSLFLIEAATLNRIKFGDAGLNFVGNIFYDDKLLVVYNDHLMIIDLQTFHSTTYPFEGNAAVEWAYFVDADTIRIIHYDSNECSLFDLKTGKITETRSIAREGASSWIVRNFKMEDKKNIMEIVWRGAEPEQVAEFLVEE
jgi:hypothetical protein